MHAVAAASFKNRTYRTMVRNVELMTYWMTMHVIQGANGPCGRGSWSKLEDGQATDSVACLTGGYNTRIVS